MINKTALLLLSLFIFLSINANAATSDAAGLNLFAQSNLRLPVNEADFCIIQSPSTITVSGGFQTPLVRGQIFEIGVTDPPGASPLITAEIGYGTAGSDPRIAAGWTYFPAVYNLQSGLSDEYQGTLTSPTVGGIYSYVYRFSFDSGLNWSYADLDGAGTNAGLSFNPNNLGTMTVNAPTAASATVSGRVFTPSGRGLANAYVVMTNQNGESVRTRTNQFGYYRFNDVQSGETYIFNVQSKRYQFATQVVNVAEDLDGLNFFAQ
jgi:Carboxypeptidase regulatory-like domain